MTEALPVLVCMSHIVLQQCTYWPHGDDAQSSCHPVQCRIHARVSTSVRATVTILTAATVDVLDYIPYRSMHECDFIVCLSSCLTSTTPSTYLKICQEHFVPDNRISVPTVHKSSIPYLALSVTVLYNISLASQIK